MSGCTIWLTGLSGSGKTTIARELKTRLSLLGHLAYCLDGDVLRTGLNSDLKFSPDDRKENIRRVGEVSALFADAGVKTICSFISPYICDRDECRDIHVRTGKNFFEVFVDAPLAVCESRDPKGLYKKARAGIIKDFTGIDAPYQEPINPDLTLKTNEKDIGSCVNKCLNFLIRQGMI